MNITLHFTCIQTKIQLSWTCFFFSFMPLLGKPSYKDSIFLLQLIFLFVVSICLLNSTEILNVTKISIVSFLCVFFFHLY